MRPSKISTRCFGLFVILFCYAQTVFAMDDDPRFAVYFVDFEGISKFQTSHGSTRYAKDEISSLTQGELLGRADIQHPPILTESDISEYCWDTGRIVLTERGADNWNKQIGSADSPHIGRPLLIVVDGVPCYCAVLWSLSCSSSPPLPTILDFSYSSNEVVIGGEFSLNGSDEIRKACLDTQVKRVFAELGVLRKKCGE